MAQPAQGLAAGLVGFTSVPLARALIPLALGASGAGALYRMDILRARIILLAHALSNHAAARSRKQVGVAGSYFRGTWLTGKQRPWHIVA
jgi:hypothetical protein